MRLYMRSNLLWRRITLTSIKKDDLAKQIDKWHVLLVWDAHSKGWVHSNIWSGVYDSNNQWGLDVDNNWTWSGGLTMRLNELLDGKTYVWVFTSLYSSLLNAWRETFNINWSVYVSLLNAVLSLLHMLAVAIPLFVMAIVFMARIGVLWIAIALSPIVVLLKAFGFDKSNFMEKSVFKYLKVENLITIIFYPAIVCFAVSMSTVLVRAISTLNMWEVVTNPEILWWLVKLDIAWFSVWLWKLIVSLIWVAITWFLVWAAVESSKLWEMGIVKSLKWLATDAILSAKIVPIPGKDWKTNMVWLGAVFGDGNWRWWIVSSLSNKFRQEFEWEEQKAISQLFESGSSKHAEELQFNTYQQHILANPWDNWQTQEVSIGWWSSMVFNNLDENQKKTIIDKINSLEDQNQRAKFSGADIIIGKDTYKFRQSFKDKDGKDNVVNKWLTDDQYNELIAK